MDRERELALRESIALGRLKLESAIETLPDGAFVLSGEWLSARIVLEDLERELEDLRDPDDWSAPVCVPRKPPPHLNSGAIALPEPE
jgi:hypothetical protein